MVHNFLPADKIIMVTFNRGFSNFTLQSLSKQKLLLIFFENRKIKLYMIVILIYVDSSFVAEIKGHILMLFR